MVNPRDKTDQHNPFPAPLKDMNHSAFGFRETINCLPTSTAILWYVTYLYSHLQDWTVKGVYITLHHQWNNLCPESTPQPYPQSEIWLSNSILLAIQRDHISSCGVELYNRLAKLGILTDYKSTNKSVKIRKCYQSLLYHIVPKGSKTGNYSYMNISRSVYWKLKLWYLQSHPLLW